MTMARSSRNNRSAALALVLVALAGAAASAHRRDEYLQAARIAIEPDRIRIELELTPGIAVADSVLTDIDRDRDGSISAFEERAYVERVVGALSLGIDGRPLALHVTGGSVASVSALRGGEGTIRIDLAAPVTTVTTGSHHLLFRNAHRPDVSVYLANALVPENDRVAVTNQRRDYNQRALDVDYVLRDATQTAWWRAGLGAVGVLVLLGFIVQQKRTL
jgi:hypothetical protein